MDQGVFDIEGKLYYRELIARFGHHMAMNWNLGEENNQPISEVKKVRFTGFWLNILENKINQASLVLAVVVIQNVQKIRESDSRKFVYNN